MLAMKKRKYSLNEGFFNNINESSSYWLGFLYADGSVRRGRLRLKLKVTDRTHIEKFLKDIGSNAPIKFGSYNNVEFCEVHINSTKFVDRLFELGCLENKTQKIRLPNIPNDMINHFIRGYFDGDGCISKVKDRPNSFYISICSNRNFINDIYNFFKFGRIINFKNYSVWSANRINDIKYFRNFIYNNKETYLDRKFKVFSGISDNFKRDYSLTKILRKTYKISNPLGDIFIVNNLMKFCISNNLVYSTMSNLSRGIGNSNKGWICELIK
jgi:intein/homing endonuclease